MSHLNGHNSLICVFVHNNTMIGIYDGIFNYLDKASSYSFESCRNLWKNLFQ